MYECTICQSLNHSSRLHCQNCGAIPAIYSWTGGPINTEKGISVAAAKGCDRSSNHKGQRINLRTVTADYYAGE
jgi:hypothetical protein